MLYRSPTTQDYISLHPFTLYQRFRKVSYCGDTNRNVCNRFPLYVNIYCRLLHFGNIPGNSCMNAKTSMKMAVFWDVAPCSLVDIDDVSKEAVSSCETLVNIYQTSQYYIPEGSHLQDISLPKQLSIEGVKGPCVTRQLHCAPFWTCDEVRLHVEVQ
jgi:hypothetical protein